MNTLRLIKIYELRGKVHPIEAFMIDLLDGMENRKDGNFIDYRKDKALYFSYHINKYIFTQWRFTTPIKNLLKIPYEDSNIIIKYLLEKHLKIEIKDVS